jgi:putative hydrolase of the HAD superfamily
MYRAVIFDFFGVFCPDITMNWFKQTVPNYDSKLPAFHAICTRSDYGKISREDFFKEVSTLAGVSTQEMANDIEALTIIDTTLVAFAEVLRKSGYKLACLSNGTHEWTLRVITDYELNGLFDDIVLSADLGIAKPNPEIYEHTLALLNIEAGEAIFVDDRQINVDTANSLGIRGLLFNDTATFVHEFENLAAGAK